jgi:predicted kinase
MMKKKINLHSLVLMVGPSGAGKSTIIKEHFDQYEVVSSDAIRQELVGDFRRQDINHLVFKELNHRVKVKLELGERVIVDATNLNQKDRTSITSIGVQLGVSIYYIVVNRPLEDKLSTGDWRLEVPGLIEKHDQIFKSNERDILRGDGVALVIDTRKEQFEVVKKVPNADITDYVLNNGFKGVMAIADVHGMAESLKSAVDWAIARNLFMVFLGDVVDYGQYSLECVNIARENIIRGRAILTLGNHERKIERWLSQYNANRLRNAPITINLSEGNRVTTNAITQLSFADFVKFETKFNGMLALSRNHINMDNFLFTHGAAHPDMFKTNNYRLDKRLESLALYGEVDQTNPTREDGYPTRVYKWVDMIPDSKHVVVGHDIRSTVKPLEVIGAKGGTATFIDTGSGKGGHLTTAHIVRENNKWKIEAFSVH